MHSENNRQVLSQRQASDAARRIPFDPNNPPNYEVLDGLWRIVHKQLRRIALRGNIAEMQRATLRQVLGVDGPSHSGCLCETCTAA